MIKSYLDKVKKISKQAQAGSRKVVEELQPSIDKSIPYVNKGIELTKASISKVSDSTKIGSAVGGTVGLIAAGTGGMGVVAMGGAVGGLPRIQ